MTTDLVIARGFEQATQKGQIFNDFIAVVRCDQQREPFAYIDIV